MENSKLYFISIHDRVKFISQVDYTLLHSYQQSTCNEKEMSDGRYIVQTDFFSQWKDSDSLVWGMGVLLSILNATLFQKKHSCGKPDLKMDSDAAGRHHIS